MDDKTKGINILPEKEKIKYCCGQRNLKLDFLGICFYIVGSRNSFLCWHENSVIGPSMEPSLYNGQEIFLNRLVYKVTSPREGDVIVFLPNGNEKSHYYVKRVVGVPGDTLYIKNGVLHVNDNTVEQYFNDKIVEPGLLESKVTLGEDEYFVIGDNCNNSEDSRSANIGTVKKSYIIGKAWMKLASGNSDMGLIE